MWRENVFFFLYSFLRLKINRNILNMELNSVHSPQQNEKEGKFPTQTKLRKSDRATFITHYRE